MPNQWITISSNVVDEFNARKTDALNMPGGVLIRESFCYRNTVTVAVCFVQWISVNADGSLLDHTTAPPSPWTFGKGAPAAPVEAPPPVAVPEPPAS